jgi:hydroxymethylglutaryl-CoA lyase
VPAYPKVEFGFHLHTTEDTWHDKVEAAFNAGCRRFDTVINGIGGCPMSGKEMIGNLRTLFILQFLKDKKYDFKIDNEAFNEAFMQAMSTFPNFRIPKIYSL